MLRVPPIALACLLLLALLASAALGPLLFPDLRLPGTNLAERLFYWDANWYGEIAGIGYQWPKFSGPPLGHYSDVAFFPLYALVDWGFINLTHQSSAAFMLLPGLVFAVWSVVAFHRMAAAIGPPGGAGWATLCYALWPGACFLLMGYPTGLINLCVIKALHHTVARRRWRGACWCGLGTAAGPTVVFVAAALCLDRALTWAQARRPPRELPALFGHGLLTIAGLLGFMAFLLVRFHDPFLFVKAQEAWITAMPLRQHLGRALNPVWYVGVTGQALGDLWRFFLSPRPRGIAADKLAVFEYQQVLSAAAMLFTLAALFRARWRERDRVLVLAGWTVLAGYTWFMGSTNAYMVDGPRMLYPEIVAFLVAGGGAAASPVLRWPLLGGLTAITVLEVALAAAGYPIN